MGRETKVPAPDSTLAVIEKAVGGHPGVLDAAVPPWPADLNDGSVSVVVVLSEMYDVLDVREDLRAALEGAGHDAEPAVIAVPRIPQEPAGAVDELAGPSGASRYEPPEFTLEADLAARLARLLGRPRVGVLDDFVDLGGDSLTAVAYLTEIQEAHGASVSLLELFAAGTVRATAELLAGRVTT